MGASAFLDRFLAHSPAQWVMQRQARQRLTVLAYHDVVDASTFGRQLDVLQATMTPVSLDRVCAAFKGKNELPPRPVLITFDDGDRTVLEHGLPLLTARGIPAVLFVITELIGTEQPFWFREVRHLARHGAVATRFGVLGPDTLVARLKRIPDQERRHVLEELRRQAPPLRQAQLTKDEVRDLDRMGVAIGNHTHTHPILPQCTKEEAEEEVRSAHLALTQMLDAPPIAFAYPNGSVDPRLPSMLAELGYEVAFVFDHALSPLVPASPFAVSRVRVNSDTSLDRFKTILSGLHPAIHRARLRFQPGFAARPA